MEYIITILSAAIVIAATSVSLTQLRTLVKIQGANHEFITNFNNGCLCKINCHYYFLRGVEVDNRSGFNTDVLPDARIIKICSKEKTLLLDSLFRTGKAYAPNFEFMKFRTFLQKANCMACTYSANHELFQASKLFYEDNGYFVRVNDTYKFHFETFEQMINTDLLIRFSSCKNSADIKRVRNQIKKENKNA